MTDRMAMKVAPSTLVEGQRLDQPTFHALYQAMSPGTRAELIDGVVYMPSPVGHAHGRAQVPVIMWLGHYAENTPGVEVLANATTILGWKSEPEPDGLLRILPERGGRTSNERGFVHGAPELVVEIAKATRYVDLGPKLDDYERAGVLEYAVAQSTRTKSTGSLRSMARSCSDRSEMMGCTVPSCFPDYGSIPSHSWRAIRGGSARWSTWAAPRPNMPRSSRGWPGPVSRPDRARRTVPRLERSRGLAPPGSAISPRSGGSEPRRHRPHP